MMTKKMGKNITAILRRGPRIAGLDNMTGVFGYANFSKDVDKPPMAGETIGQTRIAESAQFNVLDGHRQ